MPARTIYVREEDEEIWRRAEELASNGPKSLSAIVTESLRHFVRTREDRFGLVTIRVNRDESGELKPPRMVQFAGLVVGAEGPVVVYFTPKRNLVFWHRETGGLAAVGTLRVYGALHEAQVQVDAAGRPLYSIELLAAVSAKLKGLEGKTIPNEAGTPAPPPSTGVRELDV